jgi:hypothetical protein
VAGHKFQALKKHAAKLKPPRLPPKKPKVKLQKTNMNCNRKGLTRLGKALALPQHLKLQLIN